MVVAAILRRTNHTARKIRPASTNAPPTLATTITQMGTPPCARPGADVVAVLVNVVAGGTATGVVVVADDVEDGEVVVVDVGTVVVVELVAEVGGKYVNVTWPLPVRVPVMKVRPDPPEAAQL